jgi:hypothetical protein
MNNNIGNKAQAYVKETENGTVIIRMSDYYPDYTGEQEFCEVSKALYEEFYAEKKEQHKKDTVTVSVKEIYPHLYHKIKQENFTFTRRFYEELEYRKIHDDVAIWINDYYPNNDSEKKYLLVSKEVYLQLIRNRNKEEYEKQKIRKNHVPFAYDDAVCGEMYAIFTDSHERNIDLELTLRNLFMPYGENYCDVAVRYFIDGESPTSIAANVNKSRAVVWKMLRKIKAVVKDVGYSYFK